MAVVNGPDEADDMNGSEAVTLPRGHAVTNGGREVASPGEEFYIHRSVYTQPLLKQEFREEAPDDFSLRTQCRKCCLKNCCCAGPCLKRIFFRTFPFVRILRDYSVRNDLPSDVISGLTIGIMHIPQGMAYGLLAGLTPVYGLYTSFFPVLIYFLLGSSRHISLGTFAVTSLMVGSVAEYGDSLYNNHTQVAAAAASSSNALTNGAALQGPDTVRLGLVIMVTFCAGMLQFLMGLCRLGFVTTYLSDPLIGGFTTGVAFHILFSQFRHFFGLDIQRYRGPFKLIYILIDLFSNIPDANVTTVIMSLIGLIILILVKNLINARFRDRMKMPVPIELILVVIGTLISHFAGLHDKYDVRIVGAIPKGFPTPAVPAFEYFKDVIGDCFAIGIVAFATSVSMAKLFAKKHEYQIDANQELIAYGVANIFSCFFGCFVSAGALARSSVQESTGGKTQIAGVVSSVLLLVVLLAVGPLFYSLPKCILGVIIMANLKGLFVQFGDLPGLWRVSIYDFFVWLVTFTATVFLDVDYGLLTGILFAIVSVVFKMQRAPACLLGRLPGTDLYRDCKRYRAAQEIPGVKIFHFPLALYYANAEHFCSQFHKLTGVDPQKLKRKRMKLKKRMEKDRRQKKPNVFKRIVLGRRADHGYKTDTHTDPTVIIDMSDDSGEETYSLQSLPRSDIHHVIIDCSPIGMIDSSGIKTILQLITEYQDIEIGVFLASLADDVSDMMDRAGFYEKCPRGHVFPSTHDAVLHALANVHLTLDQALADAPGTSVRL